MKNIVLLVLFLACVAALPHLAKAQVIQASHTGDACPNKTYTYTLGVTCNSYTWTVAGGNITRGQGTSSIDVIWNDVPTNTSTSPYSTNVQVMVGGCAGSTTTIPAYNVFVSSISNKTPDPLTINGTAVGAQYLLPFGDNTALTLKVPLVDLPRSSSNNVYLAALTYDWVIPVGWKYNDGTGYVSDGSTLHRVNSSGNEISVTPAPNTGGLISVRAVNNNCINATTGPDNSISKTASGFVTRTTPTLTIISDKSPSGGNFSLTCSDQSDYHFRVIAATPPSGGVFDNYTFNFSGPITPTGPVASATPATNFTGSTGTVNVALQARYTRNGATTQVAAPNVAVAVQPLPRPVISSSLAGSNTTGAYPVLCSPTTVSAPVAGANSYTWTATGGLGVGSAGATTLTTSNSSITVYPGSGSGQGAVTVTATNTTVASCASPASAPYNVVYGGPVAHNGTLRMHSNSFDYESNCPYGCSGVCSGNSVTISTGDPNPGVLLEAVWKAYRVDVSPAQLVSTQNFTGSAANSSFLYLSLAGAAVGSRYEVQLQERNSCGLGPVFTYQLEVIDCAGGYEPFFRAPSQPALELAAYPNPANESLTVAQGGGPLRLFNAQGQPVRSQLARPGRLRLDTSRLPAGLYFLEMRDAKDQPVRRQLRIAH